MSVSLFRVICMPPRDHPAGVVRATLQGFLCVDLRSICSTGARSFSHSEILLANVAGAALLRQQARNASVPQHERSVALFTVSSILVIGTWVVTSDIGAIANVFVRVLAMTQVRVFP